MWFMTRLVVINDVLGQLGVVDIRYFILNLYVLVGRRYHVKIVLLIQIMFTYRHISSLVAWMKVECGGGHCGHIAAKIVLCLGA